MSELLIALIFMGFPLCQAEFNFTQSKLSVAVFKPTVILLFTNFLTEYFFAVKGIINSFSMRLSMTAPKISIHYSSHHTEAEFKNIIVVSSIQNFSKFLTNLLPCRRSSKLWPISWHKK